MLQFFSNMPVPIIVWLKFRFRFQQQYIQTEWKGNEELTVLPTFKVIWFEMLWLRRRLGKIVDHFRKWLQRPQKTRHHFYHTVLKAIYRWVLNPLGVFLLIHSTLLILPLTLIYSLKPPNLHSTNKFWPPSCEA